MTVTAIETRYAGCRFRSRLEARWAVFFDALGIPWKYEPQGYIVDGEPYLPDFWIGGVGSDDWRGHRCWVEVKGSIDRSAMAKLAVAAGPSGLPVTLDSDKRPDDFDFGEGRGWLDVAIPVMNRILVLGDVPIPGVAWVHPMLLLSNGRHVTQMLCQWSTVGTIPTGQWREIGADPPMDLPHGRESLRVNVQHNVCEAYRAARSARFEHGESGGG